MALTNKQRAFIEYYLGVAMWNATQAARLAGYAHPNMAGSRLMAKDSIKQAVVSRLRAMGAAAEALMGAWLKRIRADISPYVGNTGIDIEALKAAGLGYLIKGVRKTRDGVTFELRDPDLAETNLAKHLQMFVRRLEHTGKDGGPIERKDVTDLSDAEAGRRLLALLGARGTEDLDGGASEE